MSEASIKTVKQRVALVTGATGFVGGHLVRRLVRDGLEVHIVSRAGSRMPGAPEFAQVINHVHDGSTAGMVTCVAQAKPDVVFHLASIFFSQHTTKDIESLIQSNVLFGNQLLEAMKVNEVNCLINTGTSWQHYSNDDYNPVCLYAATKQAFEAILEYYIQTYGIKAITLKLFDTYGPDDPRPKLFHLLEKASISNEPLLMSPGEQSIDLVHIDDVITAYTIAAERLASKRMQKHEIYAISSGEPVSLRLLVKIYEEVIHVKLPVQWGARPYREREVMTLWSRGKKLPNWEPKISLREGILRTVSNATSCQDQSKEISH